MPVAVALTINLIVLFLSVFWLRHLMVRRLDRGRLLEDLRQEVADLTTELNRAGDNNISVLEDRISQLRASVSIADRQIEELQQLLNRLERVDETHAPAPEAAHVAPVPATHVPVAPVEPAEPAEPEAAAKIAAEPTPTPRERVAEMHHRGHGAESIATAVGIAIGEVELMISLIEQRSHR